jgi:hypothetical protein
MHDQVATTVSAQQSPNQPRTASEGAEQLAVGVQQKQKRGSRGGKKRTHEKARVAESEE